MSGPVREETREKRPERPGAASIWVGCRRRETEGGGPGQAGHESLPGMGGEEMEFDNGERFHCDLLPPVPICVLWPHLPFMNSSPTLTSALFLSHLHHAPNMAGVDPNLIKCLFCLLESCTH